MVLHENYQLSNGLTIPKIALGTWQVSQENVKPAVKSAIESGYRHIDTAAAYENERGVGDAVRESGVPVEEIFITSKVPAEFKTYEKAKASIGNSLALLGKVDLMLIHAPKPWIQMHMHFPRHYYKENLEVWKAFEEAYEEKKVGAIGVSNFQIKDLENLMSHCKIKPLVNQICVHIGKVPAKLISFCKQEGILVEAYSPIATGKILKNRKVKEIAQKYDVSVAQLCIKFCLQLGLLPIPKTTHKEHMRQNAELDFEIREEDMQKLLKIKA